MIRILYEYIIWCIMGENTYSGEFFPEARISSPMNIKTIFLKLSNTSVNYIYSIIFCSYQEKNSVPNIITCIWINKVLIFTSSIYMTSVIIKISCWKSCKYFNILMYLCNLISPTTKPPPLPPPKKKRKGKWRVQMTYVCFQIWTSTLSSHLHINNV